MKTTTDSQGTRYQSNRSAWKPCRSTKRLSLLRIFTKGVISCWLFVPLCLAQNPKAVNRIYLTLEQTVILVNERSPFRVNLESGQFRSNERICVPGSIERFSNQLSNVNSSFLAELFGQVNDYTAQCKDNIWNLAPKPLEEGRSSPLNYTIPHYSVKDTNLFLALFKLSESVPFTLEFVSPIPIMKGKPPDLRFNYPHWLIEEMPNVTLDVTNAPVRDILTSLLRQCKGSYWTASPPYKEAVKDIKTGLPIITVEIHHAGESRNVRIRVQDKP